MVCEQKLVDQNSWKNIVLIKYLCEFLMRVIKKKWIWIFWPPSIRYLLKVQIMIVNLETDFQVNDNFEFRYSFHEYGQYKRNKTYFVPEYMI